MKHINFGIIGTGRIAAKFCQAFKSDLVQDGSVLAVASRDLSRAKEAAKAYGISRAYGSYEELLGDRDIAVVYIAVTNEMHLRCCEMAMRAGKHVICEKPMVVRAADARALAALAKEKGVFLMEALWTRFLPAVRKAEEWIREGRIGELRGMRVSLCARREPEEYPRLFDTAKYGGAILDLGIYCLHFVRTFAGNRPLRECKSVSISGESGVDISDFVLLEYDGGFTADMSCSINFFASNEAYIFGREGYIRVGPQFNSAENAELFILPDAGKPGPQKPLSAESYSGASGFEFEVAHAMECIRGGKTESNLLPLAATIEAAEIIDRIRNNK